MPRKRIFTDSERRDRASARRKIWHNANKDKARINQKRYDDRTKQKKRLYAIKRKYGINESVYIALFNDCNGRCAICSCDDKPLCIDHDHTTGKIRLLLCNDCNLALGLFQENPIILLAAINYLQRR